MVLSLVAALAVVKVVVVMNWAMMTATMTDVMMMTNVINVTLCNPFPRPSFLCVLALTVVVRDDKDVNDEGDDDSRYFNHYHHHHHYMYNHYYDRRQRYLRRDLLSITFTIAVSIPKTFKCKLLPASRGRAPNPRCNVGWETFLHRIARFEAALPALNKFPLRVRRA